MEIFDNDLNAEIIGFGALNVDKLYSVENIAGCDEESFIKNETDTPGGSAANTIVGLSRLGLSTSIIGKIAEDSEGDLIEYNLAVNGVYSNNLIYADKGATGKCLGFVDKNGERCLYIDPGVNDEIKIDEINPLNIMRCKIMHYTSFVGDSFNTQIDKEKIYLTFDKKSKTINGKIIPNNLQFPILNGQEECHVDVFDCNVVDTTGAGDSFNSGFLYSILKGYNLEKSCKIGNWVASKSIEGFGMDKFPSLKDLEEFFK